MGNIFSSKVLAENLVNVFISQSLDVFVGAVTSAKTEGACTNIVDIKNCCLADITINQSCAINLSQEVVQTTMANIKTEQKFEEAIKQLADALAQSLSLNTGDTDARNIINQAINLQQKICVQSKNYCFMELLGYNIVKCDSVDISAKVLIDQKIIMQGLQSCISNNVAIVNATQNLVLTIAQVASAKMENAIAMILLATLCIVYLGVIAGPLLKDVGKGGAKKKKWKSYLLLVFLLLAITAYVDCKWTHKVCSSGIKTIVSSVCYTIFFLYLLYFVISK